MTTGRNIRVAYVQWPEGLTAGTPAWSKLARLIAAAAPDVLVTNELPFGLWLAGRPSFSLVSASESIEHHDRGLEALAQLDVPAIISTRPVLANGRLLNQAYALHQGTLSVLHTKQVFASEDGWFENDWFSEDGSGFNAVEVLGLKVGVLLGAEAMYPEHARRYGRQGATLIVVPRAAGRDIARWKAACAMASVVSGSYVVSSNRFGHSDTSPRFGGAGLAYAPGGKFLKATANDALVQIVSLDMAEVAEAQAGYPCTLPAFV